MKHLQITDSHSRGHDFHGFSTARFHKFAVFVPVLLCTKEAIPDLIDRTVGREPETDFFYQGKHRVKHNRLIKKKGKK